MTVPRRATSGPSHRPAIGGWRRAARAAIRITALLLLLLATGLASAPPATADEAAYPSLGELQARALDLANRDRAAAGLRPLEPLPRLAEAAQRHADDMVNRGYVAHESPEGGTPEARLRRAGVADWGKSAENIGHCEKCGGVPLLEHVDRFEAMWLGSAEHRANLLDPISRTSATGSPPARTVTGTPSRCSPRRPRRKAAMGDPAGSGPDAPHRNGTDEDPCRGGT